MAPSPVVVARAASMSISSSTFKYIGKPQVRTEDARLLRGHGRFTDDFRKDDQLHAAVVELIALDDSEIKYSTVQNWYPGDKDGKGGVFNF